MARVYSTRFAMGVAPAGVLTLAYTVPVGHVAVIREIAAMPAAPGAAMFYVNINAAINIWGVASPGVITSLQWKGRHILNGTDTLQVVAVGVGWTFCVSGYLLVP